jgi:hypothetical protein
LFLSWPPMIVSPTSTSPDSGASNDSFSMTSQMRWLMNHADFWVIPRSRAKENLGEPFE